MMHLVQACTFDANEYLPFAHGVHVVAPAEVPVFVLEPAGQSMHAEFLSAFEYFAAGQSVQDDMSDDTFEYFPAAQFTQLV